MKNAFLLLLVALSSTIALCQAGKPIEASRVRVSSSSTNYVDIDPTIGALFSNERILRFFEASGSGTDYVGLKAPASVTPSTWTMTLPPDDGTSGQLLSTDGSGITSWVTVNSTPGGADGAVQYNNGGVLGGQEAQFYWDDVNFRLGLGNGAPAERLHVTGNALLRNATGSQPQLQLSEDPDNGTNKMSLQAFANMTGDFTLTLPVDDGASGEVLSTDGSGNLSWLNASSVGMAIGSPVAGGTPGSVLFVDSSSDLGQDNSQFFWNESTNRLGLGTATPNEQLEITGNFRLDGGSIIYSGSNTYIHAGGGVNNFFAGTNATYADIGNADAVGLGVASKAARQSVTVGAGACPALTSSASWHTCIGKAAMTNDETGGVDVTGGNDSIAIGGNSGFDSASPSNSIVIGNSAIGRTNNVVTIGNYGHLTWVMGSDLFIPSASPARTFRFGDAFGTDKNAGDVSFQASRSTGTGTASKLLFKGAPSATTSSTLNTVQTMVTMDPGTTTVGSTVTVKGQSTQTNEIFIVEDNATTDLFEVRANGEVLVSDELLIGNGTNVAALSLRNSATNQIAMRVIPQSGQTADIIRVDNSSTAERFQIDADGGVIISGSSLGGNVPHEMIRRSSTTSTSATCSVTCDSGERATGGGCQNSMAIGLANSYPSANDAWSCEYLAATGNCTAWAVCADY